MLQKSMKRGILRGKVHLKIILISDGRSEKIGKNTIDQLSKLRVALRIFVHKVEKLVTQRKPS